MAAEKIDFHNWGREKSFIFRVWGIWVLEKNWRHRSSKMLSTSNSDLLLYFWRTCTRCFFTDDAAGGKITATMSRGLWKRAKESEAVIFGYITNSGLNIFYIFHLLMRYSSKHTLRFYLRPIACFTCVIWMHTYEDPNITPMDFVPKLSDVTCVLG